MTHGSNQCFECGLPDPYDGQGDGIGSCVCARCPDCGWAPGLCVAHPDDDWSDEPGPSA